MSAVQPCTDVSLKVAVTAAVDLYLHHLGTDTKFLNMSTVYREALCYVREVFDRLDAAEPEYIYKAQTPAEDLLDWLGTLIWDNGRYASTDLHNCPPFDETDPLVLYRLRAMVQAGEIAAPTLTAARATERS